MANRRPVSELRPSDPTADDVADLIQTVAAAGGWLTGELDEIGCSRAPVSEATIRRLEELLARLRPAAAVRTRLGSMSGDQVHAGAVRWAQRRGEQSAAALDDAS